MKNLVDSEVTIQLLIDKLLQNLAERGENGNRSVVLLVQGVQLLVQWYYLSILSLTRELSLHY